MTPFGQSVARELRAALAPIETASIVDFTHLESSIAALINNALFYVVPTPAIERARSGAQAGTAELAMAIREVGVQPRGVALEVDRARADAVAAMDTLIDAVAEAEPTPAARCLGIV